MEPDIRDGDIAIIEKQEFIENGGIAAAMAPDYLNLRLRAASDFFLRRTDGFS